MSSNPDITSFHIHIQVIRKSTKIHSLKTQEEKQQTSRITNLKADHCDMLPSAALDSETKMSTISF